MNRVIMMGRLTKDPEVRYSQDGKAVAKFSLAVDRKYKKENEPDADFFNCTTFGKQAEFVEKYLKKATKVLVEGRIQNDNYTNREGQKVFATGIVLDNIEFCESKEKKEAAPTEEPRTEWANIDDMNQEELPFTF